MPATPPATPRRPEPVTLQTIADLLGVSRTTVSNAYGRPDQLNPALRARIMETAKALGYAGPNPAARSLRRGKSGAIGVLLCETLTYAFTDPAAVLFLQGVAEATAESGVGLLLLPSPIAGDNASSPVHAAVVDGFLVHSVRAVNPALRLILSRSEPTLIVDEPSVPGVPFVGIDDRAAARAAAAHLIDLGHRRIAVIVDEITSAAERVPLRPSDVAISAVARDRLAGYEDAVRAAGLPWEGVSVCEVGANTSEAGCAAAGALLDRSPRPTAILTVSDQLALGVLLAARRRGVAVPATLSVVGFDDIPATEASVPPLTTVRQPLLEKGRIAGGLLLNPPSDPATTIILPTELIVRASTGPAPP